MKVNKTISVVNYIPGFSNKNMEIRSMSFKFKSQALLALGVIGCYSGTALAAMGGAGSTYGLLPGDVGSAQSFSAFSTQASAAYYNPASLVSDTRGELTGGIFHAEHDLKANGRTIMDSPSQQLQLGLKTDLSSITTIDHPMMLGLMLGVEKYAKEMMAFGSSVASDYNGQEEGQYFQYGRQPLFITAGLGTKIWRGIDLGFSLRLMLHATADFTTRSTLGGDTSHESLSVSATPQFRSILGLNINWGDTFCSTANCVLDGLDTALVYKSSAYARTEIDSVVTVPQIIPHPGLPIQVSTIDAYSPETTTLAIRYDFGQYEIALSGEYQAWSHLMKRLDNDTIKDQADVRLSDIVIPRLGLRIKPNDHVTINTGIAYEESPLKSRRHDNVNYLDGDRWVIGVGVEAEMPRLPFMAYPVQLGLGYQYQRIAKETFSLTSNFNRPDYEVYGTAESSGEVHVFGGSMTIKF